MVAVVTRTATGNATSPSPSPRTVMRSQRRPAATAARNRATARSAAARGHRPVLHDDPARQVEVGGAVTDVAVELRVVAEPACEREPVVAVHLQAAPPQTVDVVQLRVVVRRAPEVDGLHAGRAAVHVLLGVEIELLGLQRATEQRRHHGIRAGVRRRLDVADQPGAVRAQHHRQAVTARHVPVHHRVDVLHQRALPGEGGRAQVAVLLAVAEHEDDVVAQRRPRVQRPRRLKHARHARRAVARRRPARARVVVGIERDGAVLAVPGIRAKMFVTVPAEGSRSSLKRFTTAVRCTRGSRPSLRSSARR